MSKVLLVVMAFLPACLCVAGAVYLAANNINGWGWFLFVACCIGGSVKFGDSK